MKTIQLQISEDGSIRSLYQDGIIPALEELAGAAPSVSRASDVEFENGGWSVRAHHDTELAIRLVVRDGKYVRVVAKEGELAIFPNREDALEAERSLFWELLPEKEK